MEYLECHSISSQPDDLTGGEGPYSPFLNDAGRCLSIGILNTSPNVYSSRIGPSDEYFDAESLLTSVVDFLAVLSKAFAQASESRRHK